MRRNSIYHQYSHIICSLLMLTAAVSCGKKSKDTGTTPTNPLTNQSNQINRPPLQHKNGPFLTVADFSMEGKSRDPKGDYVGLALSTLGASAEETMKNLRLASRGQLDHYSSFLKIHDLRYRKKCLGEPEQVDVEVNFDTIEISVTSDFSDCTKDELKEMFKPPMDGVAMSLHYYDYMRCVGRDLTHLESVAKERAHTLSEIIDIKRLADFDSCEELEFMTNLEVNYQMNGILNDDSMTVQMENKGRALNIISTEDNEPCRLTSDGNVSRLGPCLGAYRQIHTRSRLNGLPDGTEGTEEVRSWRSNDLTIEPKQHDDDHVSGTLDVQVDDWSGTVKIEGWAFESDYHVSNGTKSQTGELSGSY